jgi:hypothetical protein
MQELQLAHHLSSALNSERPRTCRSAHVARISAVVAGLSLMRAASAAYPSAPTTSSPPSAASGAASEAGPSSAKLRQQRARISMSAHVVLFRCVRHKRRQGCILP